MRLEVLKVAAGGQQLWWWLRPEREESLGEHVLGGLIRIRGWMAAYAGKSTQWRKRGFVSGVRRLASRFQICSGGVWARGLACSFRNDKEGGRPGAWPVTQTERGRTGPEPRG